MTAPVEIAPVGAASVELLAVSEAARLASSEDMTVDAALVTLDFLLRQGLLPPVSADGSLTEALKALCVS